MHPIIYTVHIVIIKGCIIIIIFHEWAFILHFYFMNSK